MLSLAREDAVGGDPEQARRAALGLLDFHALVERRKRSIREAEGSLPMGRAHSQHLDSSRPEAPQPGELCRPGTHAHAALGTVGSAGGGWQPPPARPHPLLWRTSAPSALDTPRDTGSPLRGASVPTFSGTVSLQLLCQSHGADDELALIDVPVPAGWTPPPSGVLHVSHIKRRVAVNADGFSTVAVSITHASSHRRAQLCKMAKVGLVALASSTRRAGATAPDLIFVPYLHKSRGTLHAIALIGPVR